MTLSTENCAQTVVGVFHSKTALCKILRRGMTMVPFAGQFVCVENAFGKTTLYTKSAGDIFETPLSLKLKNTSIVAHGEAPRHFRVS